MDNHLHFLLNSNIRVDLETGPRTYTSVPMSAISSDEYIVAFTLQYAYLSIVYETTKERRLHSDVDLF